MARQKLGRSARSFRSAPRLIKRNREKKPEKGRAREGMNGKEREYERMREEETKV